jgi:hypothetical protein
MIPNIIILGARHQAERSQVIDPITSLLALVFNLQASMNK